VGDLLRTKLSLVREKRAEAEGLEAQLSAALVGKEDPVMTKQLEACCSSPAAMCYWFTVSLVAWGVLSFIGIFWRPLHASSAVACLFAVAIGCLANWLRNRSFHCAITGPLFLIAGTVFLLSDVHLIKVKAEWVWPLVLIGTYIAFLLEWWYARHSIS
jgi:hypothetical protein